MGTLATGAGLGILLAAQIGPVTLLVLRSVLRGGRAVLVGLAMAGAVASVDVLYGAVGLAGAGHLASADGVGLALGLASATILVAIGARTLWLGFRARLGLEAPYEVEPRRAFATAVAATALNPLTVVLWTVSFPAAASSSNASSPGGSAALLAGVALGTLLWYCTLSMAVALARPRIGTRLLAAVDVGAGAGLLVFGGVSAYRAIHDR